MKLLVLVAIFMLTCSPNAVPSKDKMIVLQQPFTLKVGETGKAPRESLEVEFVSVADDSRCPKGVTCVWAGNAKVLLKVKKGDGKPAEVELNTNINPKTSRELGYEFRLEKLDPYPEANGPIKASDYVVTLIVHKL